MGRAARANAAIRALAEAAGESPKLPAREAVVTIRLDLKTRLFHLKVPDDLEEAMTMLHAAALAVKKKIDERDAAAKTKIAKPKLIEATPAQARAFGIKL